MIYDFLIIGQGVSGSVLHYYFKKAGLNGLVIDKGIINSSSDVAAGIVNPVTGKRFVKSWKFEELDYEARKFYDEMNSLLGVEYLLETPIFRALHTSQMTNSWDSKVSLPAYQKYLSPKAEIGDYKSIIDSELFVGETTGAYRIRTSKFLSDYRIHLKNDKVLIEDEFIEEKLKFNDGLWNYEDLFFRNIVYANGHSSAQSKFWNYLPFNKSKAEIIIADSLDYNFSGIMKHKLFVVPLTNKKLWIGSSNEWDFDDDKPSDEGKQYISESFYQNFNMKLEITNHRAAIRPTTEDRRPFIGSHPEFSQLYIFNGMGTKGFSMAPYLANSLVAFMTQKASLDPEIDIARVMK